MKRNSGGNDEASESTRARERASEGTLGGFRSATERLIRIYSFVPRDVVYGVRGVAVRVARRRERKIEEERETGKKREGWRDEGPYSGREVREGIVWVRERAKPRRNNKFRGHSRRSPRG